MSYLLSDKARRDAWDIWDYISQDNTSAADRFMDELTENFKILGRNPYLGRHREEFGPGYRSIPFGEYLIFYFVVPEGALIARVIHGRRDLPVLLT